MIISCNSKSSSNGDVQNTSSSKTQTNFSNDSLKNKINIGEDIAQISAYAKDIYEFEGIVYIDIDLIEIHYKNVDERVVINKNKKIRTYKIDNTTLIYSTDCKKIDAKQLLAVKESQLKDKTIIIVGESKNGKMLGLNFGCYG